MPNVAEGDTADELFTDENSIELTQLFDNLREIIQFDQSIAMKSAMLLKLLEVSLFIWVKLVYISSKLIRLTVGSVNSQWIDLRTVTILMNDFECVRSSAFP